MKIHYQNFFLLSSLAVLASGAQVKSPALKGTGRRLQSTFDQAVAYLNQVFPGRCNYSTDTSSKLSCSNGSQDAVLVYDGITNNPTSLTVCKVANGVKTCQMTNVNAQDVLAVVQDAFPVISTPVSVLSASVPVTQPDVPVTTQYNTVVTYLNTSYDGSCRSTVTVDNAYNVVYCSRANGDATLVATSATPPVLSNFTACEAEAELTSNTCQTIDLSGDADALEEVQKLYDGTIEHDTTYTGLVSQLNNTYNGGCKAQITAVSDTQKNTVVICTDAGHEAVLIAQGDVNPVPESLTECIYGAFEKKTCQTTNLEPDEQPSAPVEGAATCTYNTVKGYMNSEFGAENCDETITAAEAGNINPTNTYTCSSTGRQAVLIASGSTNVTEELISVSNCGHDGMMKKRCESEFLQNLPTDQDICETAEKFVSRPHCHTTEFMPVVDFLNGTIFSGTCNAEVTEPIDSLDQSHVTIHCTKTDMDVLFMGIGPVVDPYPTTISLCTSTPSTNDGAAEKQCETTSVGDCNLDVLEEVKKLFGSSVQVKSAETDVVTPYLNNTFDGNCKRQVNEMGFKAMSTVGCMKDGGEAILVSMLDSPTANPDHETLTVCMFEGFMKKTCKTANLAVNSYNDLDVAKYMLEGIALPAATAASPTAAPVQQVEVKSVIVPSSSVGCTDEQKSNLIALVGSLNVEYNCISVDTIDEDQIAIETTTCEKINGSVVLEAVKQVDGTSCPREVTVCENGSCSTADLTGVSTSLVDLLTTLRA